VFVGTHNVMHGRFLGGLIGSYQRLQSERGLDVLCLQENRGDYAGIIASALRGGDYSTLADPDRCGKAMVFDASRFELKEHQLIALPRLAQLGPLERQFIAGGVPDQRYLQIASFARQGKTVTVVNMHLDTAGGTSHRRDQVSYIAEILAGHSSDTLVVCGDTNAFALWRQERTLQGILRPLTDLGLHIAPHTGPTHFFARQREPLWTHRLISGLGRLGLDLPMRYDVICTSSRVRSHGQIATEGSDHDLLWVET
jgi:endonuclease/exonuclease/phosphatase family metal-dependent hydrolase